MCECVCLGGGGKRKGLYLQNLCDTERLDSLQGCFTALDSRARDPSVSRCDTGEIKVPLYVQKRQELCVCTRKWYKCVCVFVHVHVHQGGGRGCSLYENVTSFSYEWVGYRCVYLYIKCMLLMQMFHCLSKVLPRCKCASVLFKSAWVKLKTPSTSNHELMKLQRMHTTGYSEA